MKVVMIDALFLAARGEKPYHLKISAEAYTGNLDALHRPGFITVQFNTLWPFDEGWHFIQRSLKHLSEGIPG